MLSRCRRISTLSRPAARGTLCKCFYVCQFFSMTHTVLFDIFPVSNSRPAQMIGVQKRMSTNTDAESSQSSYLDFLNLWLCHADCVQDHNRPRAIIFPPLLQVLHGMKSFRHKSPQTPCPSLPYIMPTSSKPFDAKPLPNVKARSSPTCWT